MKNLRRQPQREVIRFLAALGMTTALGMTSCAEAYDKLRTALNQVAPNHVAIDQVMHTRELVRMSGPFEIYTDEFSQILGNSPELMLISSDLVFAEGVCWLPSRNYVIVSDFPNNRIMKWDETSGMGIFPPTIGLRQRQHRRCRRTRSLVLDPRPNRRPSRTTTDHSHLSLSVTWAASSHHRTMFVVKSDGSIWFSDPDYGFLHPEFGHGDKPEQDRNRVYRVNGDTLAITVVSEDFDKPNGIAFSPDETVLYVGDTGRTHGEFRNHRIMRFDVTPGGESLVNPTVFADIEPGVPDGFRCDTHGNLYVSARAMASRSSTPTAT